MSPQNPAPPEPDKRYARRATMTVFFILGYVLANWVTRIPYIKSGLDLSESELGLALFAQSFGGLIGLSFASQLVERLQSRNVVRLGGLIYALSFPVLVLAPTYATLWVALLLYGGGFSLFGTSMNVQAVEIENRYHKPIMVTFHALFSVGMVGGSLTGALMASLGISALLHFALVSAITLAGMLLATHWMVPVDSTTAAADGARTRSPLSLPPKAVLGVGIVVFLSIMGENTVGSWSSVYLSESLGATAGVAALGFAAYSFLHAAGRLSGDYLNQRIGAVHAVRLAGLLAALGMALVVGLAHPVAAIIGFGLVGAGLSIVVPLGFSAAGRTPGFSAGRSVAGVSIFGKSSALISPPIIGLLAESLSLQMALGLVVVSSLMVALIAGEVRRADFTRQVKPVPA